MVPVDFTPNQSIDNAQKSSKIALCHLLESDLASSFMASCLGPEAAMKKNTAHQDDWVYLQYPQALFVPSAIALMQE